MLSMPLSLEEIVPDMQTLLLILISDSKLWRGTKSDANEKIIYRKMHVSMCNLFSIKAGL